MQKFKKGLGTLITLAALGSIVLLGLPSGAHADQITLGLSSQNITFTGNGSGSVTVSTTGLTGNAFFDSDVLGTYALGAATFMAGPQAAGLFPTTGTESFSFTSPDGDALTGTITGSQIQDNTTQPKFFGSLKIATITGDAAFLSAMGAVNSIDRIDFTTNPLVGTTSLDALALTTGSATATVSSGEVVGTPEPSSLVLFGIGLVVLCVYMRRKLETLEIGNLAA